MSNKPTVNGQASICNWDLEFNFKTEQQVRDFIALLIKDDLLFETHVEKTDFDNINVNVRGIWANNLVRVAKMVEEVDYEMD